MSPIRPPTSAIRALLLGAILAVPLAAAPAAKAQSEPVPNEVESAVDRGLEWLRNRQERDGSWSSAGGGNRSAAITGLTIMAFMARGHVPGQGPYGENINKGIDYLLSLRGRDGLICEDAVSSPMYDHGIATVALCEAYGMMDERRQELTRTAVARAIRLILSAQSVRKRPADQGGWRYQPATDVSDLSVTGWQLMALRGAANIGADVPAGAISAGIAYVKRQANGNGSFNYTSNAPTVALTGTGVLSLVLLGQADAPQVRAGGDYLLTADIVRTRSNYFYTIYYCSQAAWQLGGKYWTDLNREISADLLRRQRPNGSWGPVTSGDSTGGESYCTAMAVLALSVPYRYLPIYQR
jgi:hypothetical protein